MVLSNTQAEKTIFDVLRDIWRGKFYLLFFGFFALVLALVFVSLAQDYYRADMIVAPATPMMGKGMDTSSRLGEGSIQVQQEELESTAAFMRFETIYDGISVASVLVRDTEILDALKFDRPFEFSKPKEGVTAAILSDYMARRVTLEPVSGTPMRKLSYLHPNKEFATYMIARVHNVTDEIIRRRILLETNGRIDYLNAAMGTTTNPDHRRNLTALLMEQERLKMLVSLDQPFAAAVVERPHISSRPAWPDPYVIYPVALLIGFLLGFLIYGLRYDR